MGLLAAQLATAQTPTTRASRTAGASERDDPKIIAGSQPSTSTSDELPAPVRALLDRVTDHSLSFDQPGFYAVLEHVRGMRLDPGYSQPAVPLDDWRQAVERPGEFRGAVVTVEGRVGRNSSWQHVDAEQRRRFGTVWQMELRRDDAPVACTLICTQDVGEIGLGSTIRATGYFVMARQYALERNRVGQALLIVTKGPHVVERTTPHERGVSWSNVLIGGVGALLLAVIVLVRILTRRSTGAGRTDLHTLRPAHEASVNLADDLREWAGAEPRLPSSGKDPTQVS